VVSWAAAALALAWIQADHPLEVLTEALFVALAATALEATTHHGLDNLTVQVGASAAAWALG
jgi:dolichol kinase